MRVKFGPFGSIRIGDLYRGPAPYPVRFVTKIFYGWSTPVGVRFDVYKDDVPIVQSECSYTDFEAWAVGQGRLPERTAALSEWIGSLDRDLVSNEPVYVVSERDMNDLREKWLRFVSGDTASSGSPQL